MIEHDYRSCSIYGQENCCGYSIDSFIRRVEGFSVNLQFQDGRNINIHPFVINEVIDLGDKWLVRRQNTLEYLEVDSRALTQKSRLLYARHHHWGQADFIKKFNCPLRYIS